MSTRLQALCVLMAVLSTRLSAKFTKHENYCYRITQYYSNFLAPPPISVREYSNEVHGASGKFNMRCHRSMFECGHDLFI